jgi:hypothetical protein
VVEVVVVVTEGMVAEAVEVEGVEVVAEVAVLVEAVVEEVEAAAVVAAAESCTGQNLLEFLYVITVTRQLITGLLSANFRCLAAIVVVVGGTRLFLSANLLLMLMLLLSELEHKQTPDIFLECQKGVLNL